MSAPQIQYPPTSGGGAPVGGSGTTNTLPIWSGSTTLSDSAITQTAGTITGVSIFSAGSGYTNTTTSGLTSTGGSGTGATFGVFVNTTGSVVVVNIQNGGTGYSVGDILTTNLTVGTGFQIIVTSVSANNSSQSSTVLQRLNTGSTTQYAWNNISGPCAFTKPGSVSVPGVTGFSATTIDKVTMKSNMVLGSYGLPNDEIQLVAGTDTLGGVIQTYAAKAVSSGASLGVSGYANYRRTMMNTDSSVNNFQLYGDFVALTIGNGWTSTAGGARMDTHAASALIGQGPTISPGEVFRIQVYSPSWSCSASNALTINTLHEYRTFGTLSGSAHFVRQHWGLNLGLPTLGNGANIGHSIPINNLDYRWYAQNYIRSKTYFGKVASGTVASPATAATIEVDAVATLRTGTITNAGSGYTSGTYNAVALTGGSGFGALANITVTGGAVTAVTIVDGGGSYAVGNVLSCASIGAGANFQWTVSTIQGDGSIRLNSTGSVFDASASSTCGLKLFSRAATGQTSSTLSWYEEGSYTPTFSAAWTPGSYTATWTRIGRKVFVTINFASGTTNGTSGAATITVPTGLTPARAGLGLRGRPDGTASGNGIVAVDTAGLIQVSTAITLDTNAKTIQVEYEV